MSAGMPSWEPAKRGAPAPIQKDKRAGAVLSIRDISITSASWEKTPCLRCCAKAPSPRADLALRLPNISSHEILPSWKGDQGPETLKYRMPREGPCSRRSPPAAHRSPAGHLQRLSEICMAHGCSPAARGPAAPPPGRPPGSSSSCRCYQLMAAMSTAAAAMIREQSPGRPPTAAGARQASARASSSRNRGMAFALQRDSESSFQQNRAVRQELGDLLSSS